MVPDINAWNKPIVMIAADTLLIGQVMHPQRSQARFSPQSMGTVPPPLLTHHPRHQAMRLPLGNDPHPSCSSRFCGEENIT